MTQIVTVSPSTAAYAAEAHKAKTRTSTLFEEKLEVWHKVARVNGDALQKAYLGLVLPPALAVALLTTRAQPEATVEMVDRAYAENDGTAETVTVEEQDKL